MNSVGLSRLGKVQNHNHEFPLTPVVGYREDSKIGLVATPNENQGVFRVVWLPKARYHLIRRSDMNILSIFERPQCAGNADQRERKMHSWRVGRDPRSPEHPGWPVRKLWVRHSRSAIAARSDRPTSTGFRLSRTEYHPEVCPVEHISFVGPENMCSVFSCQHTSTSSRKVPSVA